MNARLIALAGPSRGKSFDLTEDDFSIGVRRGGDIGDPVAVEIRHRQEGYRVGERGRWAGSFGRHPSP